MIKSSQKFSPRYHLRINTEFAKKLLACARKGNAELLSVFAASFDSDYSDDLTMEGGIANKGFDKTFFLENAIDIVNSQNDS